MDSSPIGVYTMTKTSLVENFKHEGKNNSFLRGGDLWRSSFLGNLKPSDKKLGLRKSPTSCFFLVLFSLILSTIPIVVSNNLIFGWNTWMIVALLHNSLTLSLIIQFAHCWHEKKRYLNHIGHPPNVKKTWIPIDLMPINLKWPRVLSFGVFKVENGVKWIMKVMSGMHTILCFQVGRMRGTLIYDNSLSPPTVH